MPKLCTINIFVAPVCVVILLLILSWVPAAAGESDHRMNSRHFRTNLPEIRSSFSACHGNLYLGPLPPQSPNPNPPFHLMRSSLRLICGWMHSWDKNQTAKLSVLESMWMWGHGKCGPVSSVTTCAYTDTAWMCVWSLIMKQETRGEKLQHREWPRDFEIKFVSDLIWSKQFTVLINRRCCNITQG